jgi:two-component system response regulator PilR (NtrC family)
MKSSESRGGAGSAQRRFEAELAAASKSDATVLFAGEGGTGKTRAARLLHELGARGRGPFVLSHLSSLSPTLIESELFGHDAGAFTGAARARPGAFRRAHLGTIVLDDVDLLPGPLQVKLLRVLQERVVEPVGSDLPVPVDVRVVATTNADLPRLVRAGRFREDLWFRIAVVVVQVPPLRARLDELPELVRACLATRATRIGVAARRIEADAVERLARHAWPGNVRELENALERVCALGVPGSKVEPAEFDFLSEGLQGEERRIAKLAIAAGVSSSDLELAMIEEALEQQRGNVSAAARSVGLTRRAFEYRLERASGEGEGGGGRDDEARTEES